MSQKRIRSMNWDDKERKLFRMLIGEHAEIIVSKSLDTNTNRMKTKAWEQIHRKFNQLNRRPQALNQLRLQWKRMKMNARKSSPFKRETNKTGGGIRPPTPNDTISVVEIKDLLNPAKLLPDDNLYDSNGVVVGNVEIQSTSDTSNAQDHEGYVNSMISHSKMLKDNQHMRRMEMAEEEHALKMEIHKEEHAIKMEIHRENLKTAILQREILELKERDLLLNKQ